MTRDFLRMRHVHLQFGGDFHILSVESRQPIAVVHRTSEFFFLAKRHVLVGRAADRDGGCRVRRRRVVRRLVVRHVRAPERAGAVGPVPTHARRPRRGRRLRAHRTVSVCNNSGEKKKLFIVGVCYHFRRRASSIVIEAMAVAPGNLLYSFFFLGSDGLRPCPLVRP